MSTAADRVSSIDTLRGAAAVAVLLLHAREVVWMGASAWRAAGRLDPTDPDVLLGLASLPFRWGGLGVSLFFVVSGYCIHRPQALSRRPLALGRYAVRRVRRLYPVLVAALALTAGLDAVTRRAVPDHPKLGDDSAAALLANLATLQNRVTSPFGSNGPLWTLAVEVHFYAAYPALLPLLRRSPWGAVAATAVVSGLAWGWSEHGRYAPTFLAYWFCWTGGAWVAEAEAGRVRPPGRRLGGLAVAGLAAAAAAGTLPLRNPGPLVFALLTPAFALLAWWAVGRPDDRTWATPPARGLAAVGLFSYSLYATHLPVLVAYNALVQGGAKSWHFTAVLPAVAVAVLVAYGVYQAVERWTIRSPAPPARG